MLELLSYPLEPATPTYGDNPPVRVKRPADMERGDVANWLEITTINHSGAHLDPPFHFNPRGKRLTDLEISELRFDAPMLVDLPKRDGELITADDLRPYAQPLGTADLLPVRTGWAHQHRQRDPQRFGKRAPGFASNTGRFLLDETALRAIAMSIPSASPVAGLPNKEGLEFHQVVLGTGKAPHERFILLVEDVRLAPELRLQGTERVLVVPPRLADAAPVTVLIDTPL